MKHMMMVLLASFTLAACAPTTTAPTSNFSLSGRLPESVNYGDVDIYVVDETEFIGQDYAPIGTLTITAEDADNAAIAEELLERARKLGANAALIQRRGSEDVPVRYRYNRYRNKYDVGLENPVSQVARYSGTRYMSRAERPELVYDFSFLTDYITVNGGMRQLEVKLVIYF